MSASRHEEEQRRRQGASATSPGNEGARGSRGEANSGAQAQDSTNRNQQPATGSGPDLRDAQAQGGGGPASESSRAAGAAKQDR